MYHDLQSGQPQSTIPSFLAASAWTGCAGISLKIAPPDNQSTYIVVNLYASTAGGQPIIPAPLSPMRPSQAVFYSKILFCELLYLIDGIKIGGNEKIKVVFKI